MSSFKSHAASFKSGVVYLDEIMPDLDEVCDVLMQKVLPAMDEKGDGAFHYGFSVVGEQVKHRLGMMGADVFETVRAREIEKGMRLPLRTGEWFYDFVHNGKKRRCVMTPELWRKEGDGVDVFGEFWGFGILATGRVFVRVRFENA